MDASKARAFIGKIWDDEVVPRLTDYIRIPNKSPMFDKDWAAHGHMDAAVALMEKWARAKLESLPGATLEVVRLPNRTPLIFIDVPASGNEARADDCVLLYGHLDKQPEMTGWSEGLGPWTPVLKGDRLYGRGGADDGYAIFGSLSALLALQEQGVPRARCVVMIEACEESGSYDLPHYVDHLAPRIGRPSLVVCLDSGCANYDQLWLTTSLRGMTGGELTVEVLNEGVHSGDASGVVPDSFRIMRDLLSRLEDPATGTIVPKELYVEVPAERVEQAKQCAAILGDEVFSKFPWKDGMQPVSKDRIELILNRTWRPQLAVTGVAGLPPLESAGNVLRPLTSLKLSLRVPPTANGSKAGEFVKRLLERSPYGAKVTFKLEKDGSGWNAPKLSGWLDGAVSQASQDAFGAPPAYMGEGGSIPFMGMLGEKFPKAQFLITGVLGPHSNAHGPNKFLHIPTGKKVSQVVAGVVAAHAKASAQGTDLSELLRAGLREITMTTIRLAMPADAEELAKLSGQLGYPADAAAVLHRLEGVVAHHAGVVLVAIDPRGGLAGFAHVEPRRLLIEEPFAELDALVVSEAARGQSVGSALLAAAEAWARERGLAGMRVRSNILRERAHRFYLREGYVEKKRQAVFLKQL